MSDVIVSQIARYSQLCWNICLHINLEHNHRHLMASIKSYLISFKLVTSVLITPTYIRPLFHLPLIPRLVALCRSALLEYLLTYKLRAQSPSPDGKYQIISNFVQTCDESLDYAYLYSTVVSSPANTKTRCIVPVEAAGADRVPIVPEDSGSHRHRETNSNSTFSCLSTM